MKLERIAFILLCTGILFGRLVWSEPAYAGAQPAEVQQAPEARVVKRPPGYPGGTERTVNADGETVTPAPGQETSSYSSSSPDDYSTSSSSSDE